jgi:integrase
MDQNTADTYATSDLQLASFLRYRGARLVRVESIASDFVFHRSGRPVGGIRKAWTSACLAAGIQPETKMRAGKAVVVPGRKVHDFRRTAARDMIRSGTPETVVMAVTGHTTRAMLDRYNITSERDTREAMEALSARRAGKGGEA